jgi:hypothetical protein
MRRGENNNRVFSPKEHSEKAKKKISTTTFSAADAIIIIKFPIEFLPPAQKM